MKILVCHNFYQQPGGEDQVFNDEVRVLQENGHEVFTYTRHNDDIHKMPGLIAAVNLIWSWRTYREVRELIRQHRPDIVHVHNFFPLISPSVFYAARAEHVPVVLTLHNSRLMCPSAHLMRQGQWCDECVGKLFASSGVKYHCYRASFFYTFAIACMSAWHRLIGTWDNTVSAYTVPTDIYRKLFIRHGLPEAKIHVKPNMVGRDPGLAQDEGAYALFVGRLSEEKGLRVLVNAWKSLYEKGLKIPLKIRGAGVLRPLIDELVAGYGAHGLIVVYGSSREGYFEQVKGARFVVCPSYAETFGLVTLEAFACGRPVIASDIGVLAEHVKDETTGFLFPVGDSAALAEKMGLAWDHPDRMRQMGLAGRRVYEQGYTAQAVYERLVKLYQQVIKQER